MVCQNAVAAPDDRHQGRVCYGIEVKDVKGGQNENQLEFQAKFEAAGGVYILARRLQDVQVITEGRREAA